MGKTAEGAIWLSEDKLSSHLISGNFGEIHLIMML